MPCSSKSVERLVRDKKYGPVRGGRLFESRAIRNESVWKGKRRQSSSNLPERFSWESPASLSYRLGQQAFEAFPRGSHDESRRGVRSIPDSSVQATARGRAPNAKHITNTNSGHEIHKEQPRLVIDAIREIVEAAPDPASWPSGGAIEPDDSAGLGDMPAGAKSIFATSWR